jgi:hypothetical protein
LALSRKDKKNSHPDFLQDGPKNLTEEERKMMRDKSLCLPLAEPAKLIACRVVIFELKVGRVQGIFE